MSQDENLSKMIESLEFERYDDQKYYSLHVLVCVISFNLIFTAFDQINDFVTTFIFLANIIVLSLMIYFFKSIHYSWLLNAGIFLSALIGIWPFLTIQDQENEFQLEVPSAILCFYFLFAIQNGNLSMRSIILLIFLQLIV